MQNKSNIQRGGSIKALLCSLSIPYIYTTLQGAMPTDASTWMAGNSLY